MTDARPAAERPALLPVDLARELLDVHFAGEPRSGRAIYWAVLALLLAGAAALPLATVEIAVQAGGIVRPAAEKHEVRSPQSGTAARLLVADDEPVRAGDAILVLDSAPAGLRGDAIAARIAAVRAAVHDLAALTAAPQGVVALALLRTARYRDERARLAAALDEGALRRHAAASAADRTRALAARGFATFAELERDVAAVAAADAERASAGRRQLAEWQGALVEARAALASLQAEAAENAAERRALVVRAPVSGTAEQVARVAAGSFVQRGDVVAVISPARTPVAELHVSPRDVGMLWVGAPVRLQIDAFNYRDWGTAGGRIASIADDFTAVDGRPMFRVRCALDAAELAHRSGARARIRKGMTLRARVPVSRRTLLHLLRDEVDGRLEPARNRGGADAG